MCQNGNVPRRPSIAAKEILEEFKEAPAKILEFPTPVRVKNPAAVALGKLGGSKGGNIRAAKLSPVTRKAIAQQAAKARWAKDKIVRIESEGSQSPSKV